MILAYSVAVLGEVHLPPSVQVLGREHIQCFYSERDQAIDQRTLKDEALHFYEINRQLFSQTGILEFRFPTLLKDTSELADHLAQMEGTLTEDLRRLNGLAQLTVYLSSEQSFQPAAQSGTEYLKTKSGAAKRRQSLLHDLSTMPNVLDIRAAGERVYLLIPRGDAVKLKSDLLARHMSVAGPFPPSSFANLLS
jgi:hypothetical protein